MTQLLLGHFTQSAADVTTRHSKIAPRLLPDKRRIGRQLRRDKRGAIPSEMQSLFARLKISREGWFDLIQDFSRLFRRAAGRPESLATEAARRDRRWVQGISKSRSLFA